MKDTTLNEIYDLGAIAPVDDVGEALCKEVEGDPVGCRMESLSKVSCVLYSECGVASQKQ